jgi:hypothetical protein
MGDGQVRRRQRWRVIDAVADHHDRAVLALGQHDQELLVWAQFRSHGID